MAIKLKCKETLMKIGNHAGQYMWVLNMDTLYSKLSQTKVINEASLRSGIAKGSLNAAWEAIGDVIQAWATEGHSVAIPGLGTMRFGVRSNSVESLEDVSAKMITSRRVIFTPNSDIKSELAATSIIITCYDRDGNIVKTTDSTDSGDVEDNDDTTSTSTSDTTSGTSSSGTTSSGTTSGSTSGSSSGSAGGDL